jgi:hypothetical protein
VSSSPIDVDVNVDVDHSTSSLLLVVLVVLLLSERRVDDAPDTERDTESASGKTPIADLQL